MSSSLWNDAEGREVAFCPEKATVARSHPIAMFYLNFDLTILKGQAGRYPIRAVTEQAGEAPDDFMVLDPESCGIRIALQQLAGQSSNAKSLRSLGSQLYSHLFATGTRKVESHLLRCRAKAEAWNMRGVRLRLRIDPAEIAALPWELLHAPGDRGHLATDDRTALVRYVESAEGIRDLTTPPPLRMLVAVPQGSELDAPSEIGHLRRALMGLEGLAEAEIRHEVLTPETLGEILAEKAYHVVHFIGHASAANDQFVIYLNTPGGELQAISASHFAGILPARGSLKLVVLNACEGAAQSASRPGAGLAAQLVQQGIPAVVAMQYPIFDEVGVAFARRFYHSLFRSTDAGRIDLAVTAARHQLALSYPDDRALSAPVLFMRAPDGLLFTLKADRYPSLSLRAAARDDAEARTRRHNLQALEASGQGGTAEAHQERSELDRLRRLLRLRRAAALTASLLAVVAFLVCWTGLSDFTGLQSRAELLAISLGNQLARQSFTNAVALVAIGTNTPAALGAPALIDATWRSHHAALLDQLSGAGAKVVGFDLAFGTEHPSDALTLLPALQRAAARGTRVILVAKDTAAGEPRLSRPLLTAASGWGLAGVSKRLGCAYEVPLVLLPNAGWDGEGNLTSRVAHPGLALQCWRAYFGGDLSNRIEVQGIASQLRVHLPADSGGTRTHDVFELWVRDQPFAALMALDLTPRDVLRSQPPRFAYEDVIQPPSPDYLRQFAGKLVLVGVDLPNQDAIRVLDGLRPRFRAGVEIHADAVNALFGKVLIHRPGMLGEFAFLLACALLGAWLRVWPAPLSPWPRRGLLLGASLAAGALMIYAFTQFRLLLPLADGVVAMAGVHWLIGKLQQRIMP